LTFPEAVQQAAEKGVHSADVGALFDSASIPRRDSIGRVYFLELLEPFVQQAKKTSQRRRAALNRHIKAHPSDEDVSRVLSYRAEAQHYAAEAKAMAAWGASPWRVRSVRNQAASARREAAKWEEKIMQRGPKK
jgi:hypothetical protein